MWMMHGGGLVIEQLFSSQQCRFAGLRMLASSATTTDRSLCMRKVRAGRLRPFSIPATGCLALPKISPRLLPRTYQ
jgi:hypothetical protein